MHCIAIPPSSSVFPRLSSLVPQCARALFFTLSHSFAFYFSLHNTHTQFFIFIFYFLLFCFSFLNGPTSFSFHSSSFLCSYINTSIAHPFFSFSAFRFNFLHLHFFTFLVPSPITFSCLFISRFLLYLFVIIPSTLPSTHSPPPHCKHIL